MQNDIINKYVTSFKLMEQNLNGQKDSPLHHVRQDALKRFAETGFPGRKNELWKYTDVSAFSRNLLEAYVESTSSEDIKKTFFNYHNDVVANKLVFVNGHFVERLSTILEKGAGWTIGGLKQNLSTKTDLINLHFGKSVNLEKESFSALNTAFTQDGAFIHLERNTVLEHPVMLIFLTSGTENIISNPRILVVAEEHSSLQMIEDHQSLDSNTPSYCNLVSEIVLERSAQVNHIIIQDQHDAVHQISTYKISQKKDSHYRSTTISIGGKLIRNNMDVYFNEDHAETDLRGVYISSHKNLIDNHLLVEHRKPNCLSNQLYKGILDDEGKAVFNGKVLVKEDAQKTNAYQSNKNILLSSKATINTKPELEIFADDVKCSHGATSGQLNDDAVFYLMARGIPESQAKSMLTYAFAYEVIEDISIEALRTDLDNRLRKKLNLDQL